MVNLSTLPLRSRPWREQNADPATVPPNPALTAVLAPWPSWSRRSTPSTGPAEENSRPARETPTASGADAPQAFLAASPVRPLTRTPCCFPVGAYVQLFARRLWTLTITSGSTAAPGTGPSAPWKGTMWSTPPGAGPTTPCPMDACTGTQTRSCSVSTGPSASPCPRSWSTGACPSGRSTWPSSNWPNWPGPSAPAAKRVRAMEQREELHAAGRFRSLESVSAEPGEGQAEVDAEIAQLVAQLHTGETEAQGRDSGPRFPPATEETS